MYGDSRLTDFLLNVCMWDAAILWGEGADMHCERCARGIAINLPWDAILHGSSKHYLFFLCIDINCCLQ
jgi:hypothetical protein